MPPGPHLTHGTPPAETAAEPPRARLCPNCSAPLERGAVFCPNCGQALDNAVDSEVDGALPLEPAETKADSGTVFTCENCGASVRCDPDSRTATCPFCDSPYVVDRPPDRTGRQAPEFVLGFEIDRNRAEAIYRRWIGGRALFRPGDLGRAALADGLRGIYLPFWSFSVRASSRWRANIGEFWYRTETYTTRDSNGRTVTRTRQVREIEWGPLDGEHQDYYSLYLVSASKGLPQQDFDQVLPYRLDALRRYAPRYLAGWLSEEYSVDRDEALARSQDETRRREQEAIAALLPGDTHTDLGVETDFSEADSDLILLPIYLRSYRYGGTLYRVIINGQTGKIVGQEPLSIPRVTVAVTLILAIFAAAYVLATWGAR
ncbi:zinc ribbon domain-containing protein [Isosphaeraceae bacterium EP7]